MIQIFSDKQKKEKFSSHFLHFILQQYIFGMCILYVLSIYSSIVMHFLKMHYKKTIGSNLKQNYFLIKCKEKDDGEMEAGRRV